MCTSVNDLWRHFPSLENEKYDEEREEGKLWKSIVHAKMSLKQNLALVLSQKVLKVFHVLPNFFKPINNVAFFVMFCNGFLLFFAKDYLWTTFVS